MKIRAKGSIEKQGQETWLRIEGWPVAYLLEGAGTDMAGKVSIEAGVLIDDQGPRLVFTRGSPTG